MKKTILITALTCFGWSANATVHYVDTDAVGSNSGVSWTDAFINPQLAFNTALDGDTVWIAEGTYFPNEDIGGDQNPGDPRSKVFHFENKDLKVYGGFDGTETSLSQRDWEANKVILSGDIGTVGDNTDNCYSILNLQFMDITTVIDGITITQAYGNHIDHGGLVGKNLSGVQFNNCNISHNTCTGKGGSYMGVSEAFFVNCHFHHNTATEGGTFYASNAHLRIDRCEFDHNSSSAHSGNITFNGNMAYLYIPQTLITNSLFHNNTAGSIAGGALFFYNVSSEASIHNCTFADNHGPNGASIGSNGVSLSIKNCIFWGSSANSEVYESNGNPSIIDLQNSTVEGGYATGTNILTTDPEYADATNFDFSLSSGSSAIDAGDTTGISQYLGATDFNDDNRYVNAIDHGCMEKQSSVGINAHDLVSVKIYPNPVSDVLFVEIDHQSESFNYNIRSIEGKLIDNGRGNINIPVSNLPKGVYVLEVLRGSGELIRQQFIKQ